MLRFLLFSAVFVLPVLFSSRCATPSPAAAAARLVHLADFAARSVGPRNVDIWLPPGYDAHPEKRYPVLYMHDGQNLFEPGQAFGGAEWQVDETLGRLIRQGQVPPCIVVGIWNTALRFREYAPEKPFFNLPADVQDSIRAETGGDPLSDAYLRFVVSELKPFIDSAFRTRPQRADTYIMGSSMGGLISWYAMSEYPEVFGGAGCLSTHWPGSLRRNDPRIPAAMQVYLRTHLPDPATHKLYFDYGTATLDAAYEPYQLQADAVLRERGYVSGENWVTRKFEGAEHSERSWAARLEVPLRFLMGK